MGKTRAVIVSGARTPFVRAFNEYMKLDSIALGVKAVDGLLKKTRIPLKEINALYWAGVIFPTGYPNIGREILLDLKMPPETEGVTVTRACSSSLFSITMAVAAIERGEIDVAIAGGGDSVSNTEVALPKKLTQALAPVAMRKNSTFQDWMHVIMQLAPFTDLLPSAPRVAERSTGQLMGEAAEEMSSRNGISRKDQDLFAFESHRKAAKAISSGRFADEVISVDTPDGKTVYSDTMVRGDISMEKLSALKPVFSKTGTVTAGNSSALTDGAAAILVMSEEKARELGFTPLAAFRSWDYVGVDPRDQLLIGPSISMPRALKKAGLNIGDIDIVDIHEAFAGQVLAVLKVLQSKSFAEMKLGLEKAVGEIDPEKLNLHGGSISIGHPFAATGARMVMTVANELHKSKKNTALLGICAAGGLGAAAVLESI